MASLYPAILGVDWLALDEAVRKAHLDGPKELGRRGMLRVQRGKSKVARLAAWISGMPADADSVVTDLKVAAVNQQEVWVRSFGGKIVKSTQYAAGGTLCERFGIFELRFRLKVIEGGLDYEQTGAALYLGVVTIPLPRFMQPRVEAAERTAGTNRTHISVMVTLPGIGQLISYDGELTERETP